VPQTIGRLSTKEKSRLSNLNHDFTVEFFIEFFIEFINF